MRRTLVLALVLLGITVLLAGQGIVSAQGLLSIGRIQGEGTASGYQGRQVQFRGIVTGLLEDENSRGTRFYTVFVQDVPGSEDGNPLTSDGLAIFAGARRPALVPGDIATFSGIVTEFYGLTELDNNYLYYTIESRNNLLPEPVPLDPPADNTHAAAYLERFEGMRVSLPSATVTGPSHEGCGFSVVHGERASPRITAATSGDPSGQVVGVLHPSDVNCQEMPAVAYGDEITGLAGPLTYHFNRFKIVYQDLAQLITTPVKSLAPINRPRPQSDELVIATYNINNYFDTVDDTGNDAEPKPSMAELNLKQSKIAAGIAQALGCPDVLGLQEVEKAALLDQLAWKLVDYCGFLYQVSHSESPDLRGADLALLSRPDRVIVTNVRSRQGCTLLDTGITDPGIDCPSGQQPLFSRPPLQVEIEVDDQPLVVLVNHFKSKRDGVAETAARRLKQGEHLRTLALEIQRSHPGSHVVILGDFNDYGRSAVMEALLGEGELINTLEAIPAEERYSYIFDGVSQLIDWVLVSPSLEDNVVGAGIVHFNADLPFQLGLSAEPVYMAYRASDHDVPYIIVNLKPEVVTARATLPPATMAAPTVPLDAESAVPIQESPTLASSQQAERETKSPSTGGETLVAPVGDSEPLFDSPLQDSGGLPAVMLPIGAALALLATGFVLVLVLLGRDDES